MLDILIKISNMTFAIGYWYFIIGIILSITSFLASRSRAKNNKIASELYPLVKEIKEKKMNDDDEYAELTQLYKDHKYNSVKPVIFAIITFCLSMFVCIPLISIKPDLVAGYNGSLSFFWIDNIFSKESSIYLALLTSGVSSVIIIRDFLKDIKIQTFIASLIAVVISFAMNILLAKLLSVAALILFLGRTVTSTILNLTIKPIPIVTLADGSNGKKGVKENIKHTYTSISDLVDVLVDSGLDKFDNAVNIKDKTQNNADNKIPDNVDNNKKKS